MSESLTLYALEIELNEAAEKVAELENQEHTPEQIEQALQILEEYISASVEKRNRVGKFMETLTATATAIDDEIERLQSRKERILKTRESMSKYILMIMERIGVRKLESTLFSFRAKLNPVKVVIDDEAKIPAWYKTLAEPKPPELKPDKKQIKEAIQNGEEVPGAHLEQETRLVIDQ